MLWGVLGLITVTSVLNALFALKWRQSALALVAVLTALSLPVLLLRATIDPAAGWSWVSLSYLALVPITVWWRTKLRDWPGGNAIGALGYSLALLLAFISAFLSGPGALFLAGLAIAAIIFALSRFERRPQLTYLAVTCAYLGLAQLVPVKGWPESAYAGILLLAGATSYAYGYLRRDTDPEGAQALRLSGMAGPVLGTLLGLTGGPSQAPILALATGGALLWTESYLQGSRVRMELAGALLLVAYDWLLAHSQVTEVQVYSLPWAGYFAYLASRRNTEDTQNARVTLTAVALGALTFPITFLAFSENGVFYGLELIFIGLVLMVVGSSQLNRLVLWWGGGTTGVIGLYILPKYLLPDTQLSLIAPLIGLAIFAVAVILRQTGEEDNSEK